MYFSRVECFDAYETVFCVTTFPLWFPYLILKDICERHETRWYTGGPIERAWMRCSDVWLKHNFVAMNAAWHTYAPVPFEHRLTEQLANRHRSQRRFFVQKLFDPNPLLAAYAFKSLIRVCTLKQHHVTPALYRRQESINTLRGRYLDPIQLGIFFKGYFLTPDVQ